MVVGAFFKLLAKPFSSATSIRAEMRQMTQEMFQGQKPLTIPFKLSYICISDLEIRHMRMNNCIVCTEE